VIVFVAVYAFTLLVPPLYLFVSFNISRLQIREHMIPKLRSSSPDWFHFCCVCTYKSYLDSINGEKSVLIIAEWRHLCLNGHSQSLFQPPSGITNFRSPLYITIRPHTVSFLWVPSHKSIPGNAQVDAAAKSTTERSRISLSSTLPKADITLAIRNFIKQHWTALWQNQIPANNKLAQLKRLLLPWSSS